MLKIQLVTYHVQQFPCPCWLRTVGWPRPVRFGWILYMGLLEIIQIIHLILITFRYNFLMIFGDI